MTGEVWKLSDYAQGKSYDELADERAAERKAALDKIKAQPDPDFEAGAQMATPRHDDIQPEHIEETGFALPFDVAGLDLHSPPGFVGQVADWIDSQCRYPRRRLAVASAITAVGNIGGMSHYDTQDGVTANMMVFCVAASSTGKEAVMQAFNELHVAAGVQAAMHGTMKSEQEITRNLIEHQASYYSVDEIGIFLGKVRNAQKRGGASYLEGVFGTIMSAYSKANSRYLLSGDVSRDLRKLFSGQLSRAQDDGNNKAEERALRMLEMVDKGLERPFMSVIGFTTPSTFEDVMDGETALSGFVGRAIIVSEREINPRPRKGFIKPEMPVMMGGKLGHLYGGSEGRVEYDRARRDVHTEPDAVADLETVSDWIHDYAEHVGERMGEAAIAMVRRGYELIAKISFVLAIGDGGTRTRDHVRWSFAYVKDELDYKTGLVFANDNAKARPADALAARILNFVDDANGLTTAMLANKLKVNAADVEAACERLKDQSEVEFRFSRKYRGKSVYKWFRAG